MRRQRLFWRLFWSYFWIAMMALVLMVWYGARVLREFYYDEIDGMLQARAELLVHQVRPLIEKEDYAAVDELCKQQGKVIGTRLTVILPSGQVVGESDKDPSAMDDHSKRPEVLEAFRGRVGQETRPSDTIGTDLRYVAVPFSLGQSTNAVVRASLPVTTLDRTLKAVSSHFFLNGLLVAVLVGLVSLWVSRRISRPLEELKAGSQRLARGELDYRVDGANIEEINDLAVALNQMAEQWGDRVRLILRQQNEQQAMLASMTEGVLAVDTQGTVITMNPSCAKLLGAEPAEIRGRTVHELIRKPDLLDFVEAATASVEPLEGEIELINDDTRILHAHATTLVGVDQKPIGALIMLRDITRLRRLENVRRDFVANVSHELKTPITSIKGFVETLLDGALDDKDNIQRFLEIISRQVNRLEAIIEDLLALSRLERDPSDGASQPLSPGKVLPVLAGAIEMCQQQALERQIRIECSAPEDLVAPMNVHLLEQAVMNLLDNAIKYSDSGGIIQVAATREGDQVVIRVKDEGCGIDRRHLPRLFERFYRVDKARSRQLGGTGLGLAIVKHIARAHGGEVEVESVVGEGSTFSIYLPSGN